MLDINSASMHDVVDAGGKVLIIVCNERLTDMQDSLRHQRFYEMVTSKKASC